MSPIAYTIASACGVRGYLTHDDVRANLMDCVIASSSVAAYFGRYYLPISLFPLLIHSRLNTPRGFSHHLKLLQPDNFLLFSMSPKSDVCAKLSDFGTSRQVADAEVLLPPAL